MLYRVNLDGVFQGQDIILYARATSQLPNNLFVSFSLLTRSNEIYKHLLAYKR